MATKVSELLTQTDPMQKTIIFCEDIDHAERQPKVKNFILTTEEVQRGKASNLQEALHALDGHGGGLP
ncbi:hypothetical protein P0N66_03740 [Desulfurivibrio alkaliphilus]|nr:hypothetical protein [Desulfurivibrio alkaliphilus]MDF1614058.1 hypothetical protein [Desulfurivibrio alkaliphilus]